MDPHPLGPHRRGHWGGTRASELDRQRSWLVLVTGDRTWDDDSLIDVVIAGLRHYLGDKLVILHGAARGADSIADRWKDVGVEVKPFPADWTRHGRAAGPIRNRLMLDREPDLVVAFHDDLANSRGTRDCVEVAMRRGIPVWHMGHLPSPAWPTPDTTSGSPRLPLG